ncbi:MAG: phosphoethanolamine transferase [Betaproteobacteria bacterium RIFCSPLOWO2_02_FULL_67_26]|nr:MAG: phosphoethanolamine transferase [Betaproteobacteria bacterium RIFCSPLOWO2_02_FULL_67_26]
MSLRNVPLSRPTLTLLAASWLVALGNFPFWRTVWEAAGGPRADNFLFLVSLPLLVVAWVYLLLSLVTWGRATQPVLGAVLLVSAAAGYFTDHYGMLLDHSMITNTLQTHTAEALDLLSWRLGLWLLVFGLLPALLIARARLVRRPWTRELGAKAVGMAAAIACVAAVLLVNFQHYASLARNHRELRLMLVPHNIAAAVHGYLRRHLAAPIALETVGADATRPVAAAYAGKPTLTVLVIGETARAANFSLNGYPRPTNPRLARQQVLSFSDVGACGTSTAVSLPCMFLDVGHDGFDDTLALRREGLLDVLQHAGIKVRWRDNNSGCKGVCDRVPYEDLSAVEVPGLCRGGECYDEILLHGLQAHIDHLDGDAVIVLHMKGSHGPAYFKRYPPAFEVFTPACDTIQLDRCSRESIVNAYDNTLRYSDHVLSQTIELLRSNARHFDTAMLYVSDHGESLGENGLYLHGFPYALAPREQIQVPMVLWLSMGLRTRLGIDTACLGTRLQEPLSHDNLFHSVLGLSGVRTAVYRPERDLFRPCRSVMTAGNGGTG